MKLGEEARRGLAGPPIKRVVPGKCRTNVGELSSSPTSQRTARIYSCSGSPACSSLPTGASCLRPTSMWEGDTERAHHPDLT